jgi:hypothetical protein
MNYGALITDAFWITLRNRYLWFFGFFAGAFASGGSFNFGSPPSNSGGNFEGSDAERLNPTLALVAQDFQRWVSDNLALIVTVGAFVFLIFLFFFALGVISSGALAESVATIDRGEERRFSSAWSAGLSSFWRVLGLAVLVFLVWATLLLIVGVPIVLLFAATAEDSIVSRALAIFDAAFVVVLLVAVLFIPLGTIGQFALRGLVVRGERVFASIGSGYRVFRGNLGRSLLVWLIQLVLVIGTSIVFIIAALIVGLVLALPAIVLFALGLNTAAIIAFVIAGLILLSLIIVISAALATFYHSYWTLAYLRLTIGGAVSQPGQGA